MGILIVCTTTSVQTHIEQALQPLPPIIQVDPFERYTSLQVQVYNPLRRTQEHIMIGSDLSNL